MTNQNEEPGRHDTPSLAERVMQRARTMPPGRSTTLRSKIIELRDVLNQLEQEERTSQQMAEVLSKEGVNIAEGTLRNYRADIRHAVSDLLERGIAFPSDEQIHAEILRGKAGKPAPRDV